MAEKCVDGNARVFFLQRERSSLYNPLNPIHLCSIPITQRCGSARHPQLFFMATKEGKYWGLSKKLRLYLKEKPK
jgi:hypothetical protein